MSVKLAPDISGLDGLDDSTQYKLKSQALKGLNLKMSVEKQICFV